MSYYSIAKPIKSFIKWVKLKITADVWTALICLLLAWFLMSLTFSSQPGELKIATKAWSDFGAHIPLIRSFSLGQNWPPEYPFFPGEPIRYHFSFYALVGWLERSGLNLGLALNSLSALGFGLMLWMIFRVAKLIFKSRLAGWLAIWFSIMNSSLNFLVFSQKNHLNWLNYQDWSLLVNKIINGQQFISFGPWDGSIISAFWTLNIFTNQRHFGLSLGLVWWLIWPLLVCWWPDQKPKIISKWAWLSNFLRLVILGFFPLLNQAGFLLVGFMIGVLLLGSLVQPKIAKNLSRQLWGSYILGLALASLIALQFVPASHVLPGLVWGFLATDKTWLGIFHYWWGNLGLGLGVWIMGLIIPNRAQRLIWLVTPIFIVANIWQFSPDMINNHKLVNFFTQILAIVAAGFLTWLAKFYWGWRHKLNQKLTLKLIWQALAGLSLLPVGLSLILNWSLSGIIDLFPILNDGKYTLNDWTARPISIWIKENTQPNAVILTTTYLYHPASLVGRKIFLDYGYFAWSLGYEDQKRRQLLPKLFGQFAKTQDWCKALARENISAVVVSPGESELGSFISIQDSFMIKKLSPTIKTSDNYLVFKLADYCLPVSK